MKKIFFFVLLTVVAFAFASAQSAEQMFIFKDANDYNATMKAMITKLELNGEQQGALNKLLKDSYGQQQTIFSSENAKKDQGATSVAIERQQKHIDGNLHNILGEKYEMYTKNKTEIAKFAADLKAKMNSK